MQNKNEILLTSTLLSPHEKDNSFSERLTYWLIFYHIIKKIPNCSIFLQDYYWPEFLFLTLPDTFDIQIDKDNIRKKYELLDLSTISQMLTDKKFCIEGNNLFYSSIPSLKLMPYFKQLLSQELFYNPLKNLKFKNNSINLFFEQNFLNVTSIHIRRGIGTRPNSKYIQELSNYVDIKTINSYYSDCLKKNSTPLFDITSDSYYFNIIDDIISKDKNKKIYLSYDVPEKFVEHYFLKYPNNIVTRKDYFNQYLKFFDTYEVLKKNKYFTSLDQILINLFDFFALCYSDAIVVNQSGWTAIASIYKEKKIIGNFAQFKRHDK